MRRRLLGGFVFAVFGFQALLVSTLWAGDSISKKPVSQSADQRFLGYGDGTILDKKSNLMWMKLDYWLVEKKWVNWYTAKEFAQRMNNKRFAGYERLATCPLLKKPCNSTTDASGTSTKMATRCSSTVSFQKAAAGVLGPVPKRVRRPSLFPIRTRAVKPTRIKSTVPMLFSALVRGPVPGTH